MIEHLIDEVVASMPPSAGNDIKGFLQDLHHALWKKKPVFESVRVALTSNPSRLIEATVVVSDEANSLQEVKSTLKDAWASIAYSYFQASGCVWYKEATRLRFVSVMSKGTLYITGEITAIGGSYPRLAKAFEQEFHPLPSLDAKQE